MKPVVVKLMQESARLLSEAYLESEGDARLKALRDRTEESMIALQHARPDPHATPPNQEDER